jgi:Retrotransposon gag protein
MTTRRSIVGTPKTLNKIPASATLLLDTPLSSTTTNTSFFTPGHLVVSTPDNLFEHSSSSKPTARRVTTTAAASTVTATKTTGASKSTTTSTSTSTVAGSKLSDYFKSTSISTVTKTMASASVSPAHVKDVDTAMRLDHMIQQLNSLTTTDSSLAPKPFTGSTADCEQVATWLRYFDNYVSYRQLDRPAVLNLFKLLLKDLAADWLQHLTPAIVTDWTNLRHAFEARFGLNAVQRLQRAASVWQRNQGPTETVEAYVGAVRKLAQQGALHDEQQLVYAVIRGL